MTKVTTVSALYPTGMTAFGLRPNAKCLAVQARRRGRSRGTVRISTATGSGSVPFSEAVAAPLNAKVAGENAEVEDVVDPVDVQVAGQYVCRVAEDGLRDLRG